LRNGFVVADEAEVFVGGESRLVLNVRDWVASPPWKKSPFDLVVPVGYQEK
jgi:hypothetical protein